MRRKNKMADEKRIEDTAKQMEIEMLRKMGIDVVLDKEEFNRVLKANEKVQKMEMDLSELSKLNSELKELKIEKQAVEENKQKLRDASIEQGKQNFAEFIEAVKALKDFIPASKEFSPELRLSTRHVPNWYYINIVKIPLDNFVNYDITEGKVLFVAKKMDDSIVCITKGHTDDAKIYYDENTDFVDEKNKPWYLYEKFADSNHIIELKTAIKETLEKRISLTKEQLNQAHKELHESEKSVQKKNLLANEPDNENKVLEKFKNGINISPDEFLELSRSLDSKNFELLANKIQTGTAEYWTNMACIQIEEYNTNQLKWILENREVRFDAVERSYLLNKQQDEIKKTLNLSQWAAVSDDPEIIDTVFSKMTEKDFKWAKENGVFKIAEDFYKDKNENFSFPFETLKDWVKKYDPDYSNDKIVRHFYARQVPPENQSYPIDEELENLEISIIESYPGSRYSEIINNDIPNGSMEKFGDTMNEISDDFDSYFSKGVNSSDEDPESGKAQYASFEEAVNTELPKKDGSKYTKEEMKEWHNVFERYGNAGDRKNYWSTTAATHEVLAQVMELQTGMAFVLASLKGSSQGEDVTAVIPEELYSKDAVEDLEAKYWNEGVEYLVYEDDSGKKLTQEEIKKHLDEDSVDYYVPSYKSAEKLASVLGARKGELTVYDFEGYEKTPKYEKVQYMKTLSNPFDDLRTVLKAYEHGFDSDYKLDEYDKNRVSKGKWTIATGGHDLAWEVYYENVPVASCGINNNLVGNNNNSFAGFTEADMLRVITQEYKNVKCPEIEIPTVEDYEQYLNDYFHDGSFTLEPENAFDEYPFEGLLNENLNRHFHYEKDSIGGVILSYDYSNHTEYLQPGDDANKFLEEAEKIEKGVLQVNATEQLDHLIDVYFPDFFPEDYREEDTKRFITHQEIVDAVNNYKCGKLLREIEPESFAEDAREWIEQNSPAFTDVSEMPQYMKKENPESEKIRNLCSAALKETATPLIEVPYSNKNYSNIFKSGYLETPVESIKMGEGQFVKLATPDRNFTLGAVYETLTNPSIVLEEKGYDEELEQNKPYHLYAKSFVMETSGNKKVVQSLIVAKDDKNIVVGAYPRDISDFMSEMTTAGEIIYADKNVSRLVSAFSKGVTQDIEWEVLSSPTNPRYDESKILSIPRLAEEGKITTGKLEVTPDNFNEYYNYLIRNKKYRHNSEKVTADIIKYYVKPENIDSVVGLAKENGYVASDWNYDPKKTQFMLNNRDEIDVYKKNNLHINSNGQALGFVKDNKIYINIDSFNAETPIHEYTHLWDKAIQKTNPKLWKQGVELLKKTDAWKEIERNPAYADIAGDEDLLASEVHARLVGKDGSELFRNVADEVTKTVGSELQNLRKELAEEFCSNKINVVQPYHDDLKRIKDSDFIGINFEVSAKEWTPIRIRLYCEEICDKLGLEYIDAASNYPREEGHVLSNDTYFVNLSVGGFRKFPLQHYISSDEIKRAAYKWNEDSWNYVRDNFTEWKGRDSQSIKDMSVSGFVNITLKDFVDGKNPVSYISTEEKKEQENIQMQYERKTHNEYTLMSNYGYGWEEEVNYDNLQEAKNDLKAYRENGGGSYHLKHHTRVPNGFTVEDGHYVPNQDITPENFKDYFKSSLKLRQIAGNPQKAAAYCFKHANKPSEIQTWLNKQGCTSKENTDKIFEKWAKEDIKPVQTKTKTKSNSREDESWSISD